MSNHIIDFKFISCTRSNPFNHSIENDMIGWKAFIDDPARGVVQIGEAWLHIKGAAGTRELAIVLRDAAMKLQNYGTVANEAPWSPGPEFQPSEA